jgi:metal-responsive CopG/Arc/MetJ family transcriptional regulator
MTARSVDIGIHVNIPFRLSERLEQVSKSNDVSSSEMLELLLRKYLILTSDGNTNDDRIGLSDDDT